MPTLFIELLGGFSVRREDNSVPLFESDKTRGLLAYLAVEQDKMQRRETLVGLLWPDMTEKRARANLSQVTYSLRQAFEPSPERPLFLSSRATLQLSPDLDLSCDVAAFEAALDSCNHHSHDALSTCDACRSALTQAVAFYKGPFMDGFSLPGCAQFEEWMTLRREFFERQAIEALRQLVACHESVNEIEAALHYARRWAELAPWQETAHRRVMRLLALNGKQSEALSYYDTCCRILRDEIGVEPRESTRWLVEDIRAGRIRAMEPATTLRPLNLDAVSPPASQFRPPFVARGNQLAELNQRLEQALAGDGQIVFVAGEAGSGKTALFHRFAQEAHARHPDLLVAWGQSNAFTGCGDPYLPFRQALGLLTGEARRGYEIGLLDETQAQRLWSALSMAIDTLVTHAPDLIDAFLPGADLLSRLSTAVESDPAWLTALRVQVEEGRDQPSSLNRRQLHEQTAAFLRALSTRRPLLLLLDDLQWVDVESNSLLFHLARSLAGLRLLVVGAFRQEEVDIGREGNLHPLKILLAEHKRLSGLQPLNLNRLDETERRDFVERLIDAERNQLDDIFRQALFAHTLGHALFTVETLRQLQETGILVQHREWGWVQQHSPDWEAVPSRAEGVVEARIERLPPELKEVLAVASVEGETFSAQTVAATLDRRLYEVVGGLSGELDRVHRLTSEAGTVTVAGHQLDQYRFRHSLFRQHMYEDLGEIMRRLLHRRVGAILEKTYDEQAADIAPQLALHFDLAGETERSVPYYLQVGDQARLLYAEEQAIHAYERALALAKSSGNDEQAARIHMRLGLTHHNALDYEQAQASYAEGFRLWSQTHAAPADHPAPTDRPFRIIWGMGSRSEEPTFDFIPDLFSGLVEETPDLEIVPDVAYKWKIMDGGCTYVFYLRDDVRWSDGKPVTAHDFAFAWQHNRVPDRAGGEPLYNIKGSVGLDYGIISDLQQVGVEIPDPMTLVVTLPRPAAYFLHLLSSPLAAPKPSHVIKRHGDAWATAENIVSNGPFMLDRWDTSADIMHFVRNPTYHRRSSGNVTRVEASYFRQPTGWQQLLDLYERDLVDMVIIFNWGGEGFTTAKGRHPAEYGQNPIFATTIWCFDTTRPPFNDVRVRQALAMTCDREQLPRSITPDCARPAFGGFIPPVMPGHSPDIGLPYDPDRARQLLAEAGYPHGRGFPEVEYGHYYVPEGDGPARSIVEMWRQALGIPLTLRYLDWIAYWRYVAERTPHIMIMTGLPIYGDPDAFMRQSFRTVQQLSGWRHPDYEHLIVQAGACQDQRERLRLYQQADALLIGEAPFVPAIYHDMAFLTKPWVKRLPSSPTNAGSFWKDVVLGEE